MSKHDDRGPKPADLLFNNIFADRQPAEVCKLVAGGIAGAWRNANRLLSDARAFVEDGRLSSARFLITTAREELAKAPLLLDACMLDFSKHRSVLHRLCQAFYDHVGEVCLRRTSRAEPARLDGPCGQVLDDRGDRAGGRAAGWRTASRTCPTPPTSTANSPSTSTTGTTKGGGWSRMTRGSDRSFKQRPDPVTEAEQLIEPWRQADAAGLWRAGGP